MQMHANMRVQRFPNRDHFVVIYWLFTITVINFYGRWSNWYVIYPGVYQEKLLAVGGLFFVGENCLKSTVLQYSRWVTVFSLRRSLQTRFFASLYFCKHAAPSRPPLLEESSWCTCCATMSRLQALRKPSINRSLTLERKKKRAEFLDVMQAEASHCNSSVRV